MSRHRSRTATDREPAHSGVTSDPDASRELDAVVTALLTASRALVGVAAESLSIVADRVTVAQFRTLIVLEAHGPSALGGLAVRLGVNASTALRQVDRLVGDGLVDRRANADDRRQVVISLTEAGHGVVAEVTEHRRRRVADVVRAMPGGSRHELVAALQAFALAADEPLVDDVAPLGW